MADYSASRPSNVIRLTANPHQPLSHAQVEQLKIQRRAMRSGINARFEGTRLVFERMDLTTFEPARLQCNSCGWSGDGAQCHVGETFECLGRRLADYHCPQCRKNFGAFGAMSHEQHTAQQRGTVQPFQGWWNVPPVRRRHTIDTQHGIVRIGATRWKKRNGEFGGHVKYTGPRSALLASGVLTESMIERQVNHRCRPTPLLDDRGIRFGIRIGRRAGTVTVFCWFDWRLPFVNVLYPEDSPRA